MRERWDLSKESDRGSVSRGWSGAEIDNLAWDSGVGVCLRSRLNAEF